MENINITEVSENEKESLKLKIVIIGDAGVGKTSMIK